MADAVPSHQLPPQQAAALVMEHLAFLYKPSSVSPHTSTLKPPPRYKQLSTAWRESKLPPKAPEEASRLVIPTLPHWLVELTVGEAPSLADGLKFQLHTLPVDAKTVADGDTVTVYVAASDAQESLRVPQDVQMAVVERSEALAEWNYTKADALEKRITHAGYRVLHIDNQEILARKYRIRLRGIDAPERLMPYGEEAKDELVKIIEGKCLKILVYGEDRYGRFVGDVYCDGIFVQETLLKKGLAWHYTDFDKRPELGKWEKDARGKRVGLWALSNPEMPWVWRKNHRENRHPRVHA